MISFPEPDYSDVVTENPDLPKPVVIPEEFLDVVSLPPDRNITIRRRRREWMDEAAALADVTPIEP